MKLRRDYAADRRGMHRFRITKICTCGPWALGSRIVYLPPHLLGVSTRAEGAFHAKRRMRQIPAGSALGSHRVAPRGRSYAAVLQVRMPGGRALRKDELTILAECVEREAALSQDRAPHSAPRVQTLSRSRFCPHAFPNAQQLVTATSKRPVVLCL